MFQISKIGEWSTSGNFISSPFQVYSSFDDITKKITKLQLHYIFSISQGIQNTIKQNEFIPTNSHKWIMLEINEKTKNQTLFQLRYF